MVNSKNDDDVDGYVNNISYKEKLSPITKITNVDPDVDANNDAVDNVVNDNKKSTVASIDIKQNRLVGNDNYNAALDVDDNNNNYDESELS